MSRQAQGKSATGIYYVMLPGIVGRNIFLDDAGFVRIRVFDKGDYPNDKTRKFKQK